MSRFYGILAVMGWVWAVVVFAFLFFRLRRMKSNEKHL
jgi:hypothetical protein